MSEQRYWVQVPAGAAAGTRFQASTGSATAALTVPQGMPAGEWMVINAASVTAAEVEGGVPVVQGLLVEPAAAPVEQPGASTAAEVVVGRPLATPTTLQVLRGLLAQGTPLWDAGDVAGAEAVFKAGFDGLAAVDQRLAREYAAMERQFPCDEKCWLYRRTFDTLIQQDREGPSAERFLYFWDKRDGPNWMGWWLTPEHVGCTRYYAHAPVDAATPDQCGGRWVDPMQELVVAAAEDGGMLVARAIDGRKFIEGHYAPSSVAHAHKGGPSGAVVRPVFAWDRPLSEEEEERFRTPPVQACCVVS